MVRFLRLGLLVTLVALAALAVRASGVSSVDDVREVVDGAGAWGAVLFVVVYAALTVAFVPGVIGSTAAGLLFGAALGSGLVVVGATLGATGAFLLSRALGRDAVVTLVGGGLDRVDRFVGSRPFRSVLALRLLPILPFNLVNYGAGLTAIGWRPYVAGTALGVVPGTVLFVAFGSSLEQPGSARFWWSLAGLVALTVVGLLVVRAGPHRYGDGVHTDGSEVRA